MARASGGRRGEAHGGGLFTPPASLGKSPRLFPVSRSCARARARGRIDRRGGFLGAARTPVFTGGVAPSPHGGSDLRADRVFPSPRNNSLLSELYSAARERRYRDRHASSCTRRTTSLPARDRDLCGSAEVFTCHLTHRAHARHTRCGDARPTRIARPPSIDELRRLCGARLVSSRGVAPSSAATCPPDTLCALLSRGYPNFITLTTSEQARSPAEFKHIIKRRKRN